MKKMNTAVNANDRIAIKIINHEKIQKIQYILVQAKTGKQTLLGEPITFSPSVKEYFGTKGRLIKELRNFKAWHNHKLQIEMKRIWRELDGQCPVKEEKDEPQQAAIFDFYNDERVA